MTDALVIDEGFFTGVVGDQGIAHCKRLCDLVDEAQAYRCTVKMGIDPWAIQFIYQALYVSTPSYMDRDTVRLIELALSRIIVSPVNTGNFKIIFNNQSFLTSSAGVTLAFSLTQTGDNCCLLSHLFECDTVCIVVDEQSKTQSLFFIGQSLLEFWRYTLKQHRKTGDDFFAIAQKCFPNLLWSKDADPDSLGLNLHKHYDNVIAHLAFLNDCFLNLLKTYPGNSKVIIGQAHSVNVDMSVESPSTHKNKKAMNQRKRTIQTATSSFEILCEWHTKITKTCGRIHFAAWPESLPHTNVCIGVMTDHLL